MNQYNEKIAKLGVQLLQQVLSVTSARNGRRGACNYKPLAKWFFDIFDVHEEDFVLALAYLRDYYPDYYDRINVPSQWDGCAHLDFPHLFLDGDKFRLIALQAVPKMLTEDGLLGPYKPGDEFSVPKKIAVMLIKRRMARKHDDGN